MPFTAFHLGAGLLGKGLAPKSQSLYFFAACQVVIDIEPGISMLLDHDHLHTVTHNPVGLAVIVTLCALAWRRAQAAPWWPQRLPQLSTRQLVDTGFWAGLSHLLLDAISHLDVSGHEFLFVGMEEAQNIALAMGVIGLLLLGLRALIGAALGHLKARLQRLSGFLTSAFRRSRTP